MDDTTVDDGQDERPWLCPRDRCRAPTHDTDSAYSQGCRSGKAADADHRYRKAGRLGRRAPRMVPALGATRRLQALMTLGHPSDDVAEDIGISRRSHGVLLQGKVKVCHAYTDAAVRRTYDARRRTQGRASRVAALAKRRGYVRVDEWLPDELDDPHADPRARHEATEPGADDLAASQAAGGQIAGSALDQATFDAAVAILSGRGVGTKDSAAVLRTTQGRVEAARYRVRARAEAERLGLYDDDPEAEAS